MTLGRLLRETRSSLASHGIEEAPLEAELLLMKAMGIERARLYSSPEMLITPEAGEVLSEDLARRIRGEPWPYICGYREFYGLEIAVGPGVFIPRPETELLVDLALELARSLPADRPLRIADVCTGSGAIAVALAVNLPNATVYATDLSTQSLEIARLNRDRHGLEERVVLLKGSLLEPLSEAVDLVVSNPPYVPNTDIHFLAREVRFEPHEALDGGEDGLDLVRVLLPQAAARISYLGGLVMEFSPPQAKEVARLAREALPGFRCSLVKDLAGGERALLARAN